VEHQDEPVVGCSTWNIGDAGILRSVFHVEQPLCDRLAGLATTGGVGVENPAAIGLPGA